MCTHYVVMDFWSEKYGLSQPFALPIHMKFSISFFENISYKDLIFDRWKKKKPRTENFITKA
jgi:hypothetical protein